MTEAEIAQIEAGVIAAMEVNFEGWRNMNVDQIMATFDEGTSWAWSSVPQDFPTLKERTENWVQNNQAWEGEWLETTVKVLGRDAAAFQGTFELTVTQADGRRIRWPGNASWLNVLERTMDGWKVTMGSQAYGNYEVVEGG